MEKLYEQYQLPIIIVSTLVGIMMAIIINTLRVKSTHRPITTRRIIIPPLMMSTGLFMFVLPFFHITWLQVAEALFVGMIFSLLLIRTTHFKVVNKDIYLVPSKAFIYILFSLLIIRLIGKYIIGQTIAFGEMTSMFYLLAFGMLFTWRLAMLYQYHRLKRHL